MAENQGFHIYINKRLYKRLGKKEVYKLAKGKKSNQRIFTFLVYKI